MKRKIILVCALGTFVWTLVASIIGYRAWVHRDRITEQNYLKIQSGMEVEEVEQLLGPTRSVHRNPRYFRMMLSPNSLDVCLPEELHYFMSWRSNRKEIVIGFDKDDRVIVKEIGNVYKSAADLRRGD